MYKVIKASWTFPSEQPIFEFTCTSSSDIANLPNSQTRTDDYPNGVGAGSTCIGTFDASLYILGADDIWHKL